MTFRTLIELLGMNWRAIFPSTIVEIVLIIVAAVCGAIVGIERERQEKPAGLRTLILVCVGSATFTMASFIFNSVMDDSGRVAAQVVTGVGFLGAGVILHARGTVSGATTAATIWMIAAIGMIAGSGYALAALGLSFFSRAILTIGRRYETREIKKAGMTLVELEVDPDAGRTRVRMERILMDYELGTIATSWDEIPESHLKKVTLQLRLAPRQLRELLSELVSLPAVKSIREESFAAPSL